MEQLTTDKRKAQDTRAESKHEGRTTLTDTNDLRTPQLDALMKRTRQKVRFPRYYRYDLNW